MTGKDRSERRCRRQQTGFLVWGNQNIDSNRNTGGKNKIVTVRGRSDSIQSVSKELQQRIIKCHQQRAGVYSASGEFRFMSKLNPNVTTVFKRVKSRN